MLLVDKLLLTVGNQHTLPLSGEEADTVGAAFHHRQHRNVAERTSDAAHTEARISIHTSMHCMLCQLRAEEGIAGTSSDGSNCVGRINKRNSESEILFCGIASNRFFQETSDVIIDKITGAVSLLNLCDLLVWIDEAFLSALSDHDQAVTLLFHSLNDLLVEARWTCKLKRQLRDQTKVNRVVR